jgi:hypothetical protein
MTDVRLIDVSGHAAPTLAPWEPVIISGQTLAAEADRLAARPAPANGRRESVLAHPRSTAPALGLAPGIRVTLSVLAPGERTRPRRHNSTAVGFCIKGGGVVDIDDTRIEFGRYDVWNHPSFRTYHYENDTDELQVRLTYSNAPVLEQLGVHLVEDDPAPTAGAAAAAVVDDERRLTPFGTIT